MVNTMPTANTTGRNVLDVLDDPLLRNITAYLPNEDLMQLARVSQRINHSIPRATTYERRRVPGTIILVFYMRPYGKRRRFGKLVQQLRRRYGRRGRLDQLVQQFQQLCVRDPNVLERYPHASMLDYHKFQFRCDVYSDQYGAHTKTVGRRMVSSSSRGGTRDTQNSILLLYPTRHAEEDDVVVNPSGRRRGQTGSSRIHR